MTDVIPLFIRRLIRDFSLVLPDAGRYNRDVLNDRKSDRMTMKELN